MLMFGPAPPAPDKPRAPSIAETSFGSAVRFSPVAYKAQLETDAKKFDVPPMTVSQIAAPNPYFEEWKSHRKLGGGGKLDTNHLSIALVVQKHEGGQAAGQVYNVDHLVLRIENKTPRYLAYRVETEVNNLRKCLAKGVIPQNAIVLEPGQTVYRTECLYRTDQWVDVTHVEVIEMPALSAYYVARLPPALILYDERASTGHRPLRGNTCPQTFSWREIRDGAERGELGWRDVIDFYARHNCDDYTFFSRYRYRVSADDPPLPVRSPDQGG